jgi:hypothetical protein
MMITTMTSGGLAASAALFAVGIYNVIAGRRTLRAPAPRGAPRDARGWLIAPARYVPDIGERPPLPTMGSAVRMMEAPIDPDADLKRHLADALTVMLRHPDLTVDAGTLRLLSRKQPKVRGPDGRWQKGRA